MGNDFRFVKDILIIRLCVEMIKTSFQHTLKDANYSNRRAESKANKIAELANSISNSELKGLIHIDESWLEDFENEHVAVIWELIELLVLCDTEDIRTIIKQIKENNNAKTYEQQQQLN